MWATFNCFEIQMTREQAHTASHQGQCDADVAGLLTNNAIREQLDKIGPDAIRRELKDWGAWDETELSDDAANRARIVWIAAGNIIEEESEGGAT